MDVTFYKIIIALLVSGVALLIVFIARLQRRRKDEIDAFQKILAQGEEKAQEQLKKQVKDLFSNLTEGVLLVDVGLRIVYANSAFLKMLNLRDDVVGQNIVDVFKIEEISRLVKRLFESRVTASEEIELRYPQQGYLYINGAYVEGDNSRAPLALLLFHDQTRLKILEKTRQDFVANVSHELRTPLTLIKGCVETLIDGAKNDPQVADKFLNTIKKHANRLNFLLEDLLTISKLESGEVSMQIKPFDLQVLVKQVLEDFSEVARQKNVSLKNNVPEGFVVYGDADRLYQVLYNLVDNAIKYGKTGGNVWIGAFQKGTDAQITVRDDGPGIPPEARERIFERFFRVDKARSREQGGTGLGLSIVKHIIQAHGGRVWVESELGKGAAFHCLIPMKPQDNK